jgi:hypothetical protein
MLRTLFGLLVAFALLLGSTITASAAPTEAGNKPAAAAKKGGKKKGKKGKKNGKKGKHKKHKKGKKKPAK